MCPTHSVYLHMSYWSLPLFDLKTQEKSWFLSSRQVVELTLQWDPSDLVDCCAHISMFVDKRCSVYQGPFGLGGHKLDAHSCVIGTWGILIKGVWLCVSVLGVSLHRGRMLVCTYEHSCTFLSSLDVREPCSKPRAKHRGGLRHT